MIPHQNRQLISPAHALLSHFMCSRQSAYPLMRKRWTIHRLLCIGRSDTTLKVTAGAEHHRGTFTSCTKLIFTTKQSSGRARRPALRLEDAIGEMASYVVNPHGLGDNPGEISAGASLEASRWGGLACRRPSSLLLQRISSWLFLSHDHTGSPSGGACANHGQRHREASSRCRTACSSS